MDKVELQKSIEKYGYFSKNELKQSRIDAAIEELVAIRLEKELKEWRLCKCPDCSAELYVMPYDDGTYKLQFKRHVT